MGANNRVCSDKCLRELIGETEWKLANKKFDPDNTNKVLDLRMPIDEQKKLLNDPKILTTLNSRKYKVTVKEGNKTRYIYGNDPVIIEDFAIAKGLKILRTEKNDS